MAEGGDAPEARLVDFDDEDCPRRPATARRFSCKCSTRAVRADVHKDTIVACVRCVSPPMHQEVRSFGSTTTELLALADWLAEHDCSHVAMEATGAYWKPVWHVLEGRVRAGAGQRGAHPQRALGARPDVNDAMWIADLLAHGLIRSSCAAAAGRSSSCAT